MSAVSRPEQQEQEPVMLSPEEEAAFLQGLRSEATGIDFSMEEAIEFARKKRREWLNQSNKKAA